MFSMPILVYFVFTQGLETDLSDMQQSQAAGPDTPIAQQPDTTKKPQTTHPSSASQPQDESTSQQGSIMEEHTVRRGGLGGHRERDRLRFLEGRKKVPIADGEPHVLSAEEREQVRKRREAYFMSQEKRDRGRDTAEPVEQESESGKSRVSVNHKQSGSFLKERTTHWNGRKTVSDGEERLTKVSDKVQMKVNDTGRRKDFVSYIEKWVVVMTSK